MPHLAAVAGVAKAAANACSSLPTSKTTDHSIFNPIAKPIADVLAGFYSIVPNFGVAIIILSIVWMIIIAPLTLKSTRSMLAMQKLQPQLKKLQAEHKNDRQAFAQAQMDLYKEHNVSPFGSCLPSILPLPVFFALFRVIDGLSHKVTYNHVTCAAPNFLSAHTAMYKAIVAADGKIQAFGLDLSKNALSGHASFLAALPYFVLLLIMIGTQYLQTAQMMSRNPAAADNPQMKFMKYLPIIFGVICIRFPAGVILYYAVSNICRMSQQTLMYRFDPKVKSLVAQEVIEVESNTRRIDKNEATASPAPRSRFRDLLNQAQEQAQENRDKRAKPGTTPPKGQATPGRNAAKPTPAKKAVAKKANPPAKKATPKRPETQGSNGAATTDKKAPPAKAAPAKAAPETATPDRAAPAKASNGNTAPADNKNGNGDGAAPPPNRTGGRTGAQAPRSRRRRGN
jgi:YidC/Oxa1 family membrane protein insertase